VPAENVEFVVAAFEAYEPEPAAFDLVASAQAWHWVDPAVGFPKAAAALRNRGALALFGHVPFPPEGRMGEAFRRVYERHFPGAWGQPPAQAWYLPSGPVAAQIEGSGLFGPVTHRSCAWTWRLDPQTLGRYLRTDSAYHPIPEAQRFALFDDLAQAVAENGGVLDAPWETHLYVARKR
jgi:SAM-dependent methyltransferase